MAGLQPYVLRSWEKEFPGIGVQKSPDSARFYRPSDVEQVRRIKQLVFGEGLTLAGARRRIEASAPVAAADVEMAEVLDTLGADARARIAAVRSGLRSILEALSQAPGAVGIADLAALDTGGNGGRRRSGRDRRGGPLGPPKRKAAVAASRTAASKRAAPGRKARGARRKRAGA